MDKHTKNIDFSPVWSKVSKEYELLAIIGSGSFGQVVKAKMKANNQLVAIKLI